VRLRLQVSQGGEQMPKRWWMSKTGVFVLAMVAAAMALTAGPYSLLDSQDLPDPEEACKIQPVCDSHPDCDAICGSGLGRCVRNKCPIRICRCG